MNLVKKLRSTCLLMITAATLSVAMSACAEKKTSLKLLQLNLWHQTTKVPGGFEGLVSTLEQTDPDVIFFCETRMEKNHEFVARLKEEMKKKGKIYYGEFLDMGPMILSKYPVSGLDCEYTQRDLGAKGYIEVAGQKIAIYSVHLDYTHYECYMPRGYSGTTWKKMDKPCANADSVLAANRLSYRDEVIKEFILDAQKEIKQGNLVIMGGDFNEPSHLDWQADTKDLYEHNGLVINWDCSKMLQEAGYIDSYRRIYPSAVTHPAFTFAAGNKDAKLKDLAWTEGIDDRDRIDFVYFMPSPSIELKDAVIVGPREDLYIGKIVDGKTQDAIFTPKGTWPTDHKGNLVTFDITEKK